MASSAPLPGVDPVEPPSLRQDPSTVLVDVSPETEAVEEKAPVLEDVEVDEDEDDEDEDEDDADDVRGNEDEEDDLWKDGPDSDDDAHHRHTRGILSSYSQALAKNHQLPPLPDLRFEQSYLRSLAAADTWWKVGLVTVRDQVLMPLVQGVLYNLAVCGWQSWNRNAQLSGKSVGARVRRWWYGVNNWPIPKAKSA